MSHIHRHPANDVWGGGKGTGKHAVGAFASYMKQTRADRAHRILSTFSSMTKGKAKAASRNLPVVGVLVDPVHICHQSVTANTTLDEIGQLLWNQFRESLGEELPAVPLNKVSIFFGKIDLFTPFNPVFTSSFSRGRFTIREARPDDSHPFEYCEGEDISLHVRDAAVIISGKQRECARCG
jgi:hypothetical protein